jgi:hypothetical protein
MRGRRPVRVAISLALAASAICGSATPQRLPKRKISCKTPDNAPTCYWMHGRLSFANTMNSWIFADFEICPLRPEVKGEMQDACVESARNIVTEH